MFSRITRNITMSKRLEHLGNLLNTRRQFSQVRQGSKYSPNFRQYLQLANGEIGSYFHDIPLELNSLKGTVRMVVEIPRWSNAKFEISKDIDFNPITQDVKKGKVRFVHNLFPYHGYIHNYGAIPQTWEDPAKVAPGSVSNKGDNDPLDCCEIGSHILQMGDVKDVKILGSLALIDDGELDWKIIAINIQDPLADKIDNLRDVEIHMPGLLAATREWFRNYKIPAGKPANVFAFDGRYKDIQETLKTIQDCHEAWKELTSGNSKGEKIPNITRAGSGATLMQKEEKETAIPPEVDAWHYI